MKRWVIIFITLFLSAGSLCIAMPIPSTGKNIKKTNVAPRAEKAQAINKQIERQRIRLMMQARIVEMDRQILQLEQRKLYALITQAKIDKTSSAKKFYHWEKIKNSSLPKNAVIAGNNKNGPVYICQSKYQKVGVHPGELTTRGCLISYRGKALVQSQYKLLTSSKKIVWKNAYSISRYQQQYNPWLNPGPVILNGSNLPANNESPVIGGHEKGHDLYICRGMYHNEIHVGKVVARNCNIGVDGKEIKIPTYEVLFNE